MNHGTFNITIKVIHALLCDAVAEVVHDIGDLFGVVDEDPITFAFVLAAKRLIVNRQKKIKEAAQEDIAVMFQAVDAGLVREYVAGNLAVGSR